MNKLIVDENNFFPEEIIIDKETCLYINNISNYKGVIKVLDNIKLDIYMYNNKENNIDIYIEQNNSSKVNLYHTFEALENYNLNYKFMFIGNNNINNVNITGITKNKANIIIEPIVNKNTKDNELNENVKILTIGGKCFVSPMIKVSALEVIANHNTAISNVREDELLYLMSKGITKEKSIKLIENSYKYGIFKNNEDFINLIKE